MPAIPTRPDHLSQPLDAAREAPSVQPEREPVGADLGEQGRELSTGDAMQAVARFFADFDRRVRNQRIVDASKQER